MNSMQADSGSFRDPSGFVFLYEGQVYRSLDRGCADAISRLDSFGLLASIIGEGLVVPTSLIDASSTLHSELLGLVPGACRFLHHEKIPFLSYPYEWSAGMLADAAELTLVLQKKLLAKGYSLKDASAYNIQFLRGKPVFIDIPSIEIPDRLDMWIAYGQFCRMFLFPLLLREFRGYDTKGYFLANIEGLDVEQCYRTLGVWTVLRPSCFVDVFLQRILQVRHLSISARSPKKEALKEVAKGDPLIQQINLDRLLRKIRALRGRDASPVVPNTDKPDSGETVPANWSQYEAVNSYPAEAENEKARFIQSFLADKSPGTVLDLGCNAGKYSLIAAKAGARVVAVDGYHDCVDKLYSRSRAENADLLPLWMDVANPSPAIGFMNKERSSFLARADFDCVFALALVHHLLVSARIPLAGIRDLLWGLTTRWLIVECVPVGDPMFLALLALRKNIYSHITPSFFVETFAPRFKVASSYPLRGTERILYRMEKYPSF